MSSGSAGRRPTTRPTPSRWPIWRPRCSPATRDYPRLGDGYGHDTVTFKGVVGLELKARGFDVGLEVYEDEDYFDARAEIVITSPDLGDGAPVHVTDDGSITWTRDYWAEAATVIWEPDFCGQIADPQKVAAAVVATITAAMSHLAPAGR
jgi:hypothetical protein